MSGLAGIPISFVGDVNISNIDAAHTDLGAALRQGSAVLVDISGVTEVDLTFVQLIEAARQASNEAGHCFELRYPAAGAVLEVLQRGGFLDDEGSDRAKFWLQGPKQ
ncbi:STAS domain-containing protein [Caulobacter sp. Root1455]|uniref:STAS domain-containing protein n=1 Tax=Caulobacter sp. Root1455 TaxID=1736465 RepID=UPI000B28C4DC|nr:STAS domain-containing protein [Caulobacter sp. Root1455]